MNWQRAKKWRKFCEQGNKLVGANPHPGYSAAQKSTWLSCLPSQAQGKHFPTHFWTLFFLGSSLWKVKIARYMVSAGNFNWGIVNPILRVQIFEHRRRLQLVWLWNRWDREKKGSARSCRPTSGAKIIAILSSHFSFRNRNTMNIRDWKKNIRTHPFQFNFRTCRFKKRYVRPRKSTTSSASRNACKRRNIRETTANGFNRRSFHEI